jgi:hypothetical protein
MEIRHAHEKIAIKNCYTGNALQGMHYDEIAKNDLAGFHVTGRKKGEERFIAQNTCDGAAVLSTQATALQEQSGKKKRRPAFDPGESTGMLKTQ